MDYMRIRLKIFPIDYYAIRIVEIGFSESKIKKQ
jgi:hypothetical protein